jgi:glycosyltransferase involved in cell wall biosynthesis
MDWRQREIEDFNRNVLNGRTPCNKMQLVSPHLDLAVFYADPFYLTAQVLKAQWPDVRIVADLAPHIIEVSRAEHVKLTGGYPFPHLTDNALYRDYSGHLRIADTVITHSHASAAYIKDKAMLRDTPVVISYGCTPPPESDLEPHTGVFRVGHLSAPGIDKGQVYLLDAWASLHPCIAELWMAGGGLTPWWHQYDREKYNGDLERSRHLKIFDERVDLKKFYNGIDVYVQPSCTEGFAITVLEAMSYGKPVIVSEGAGVSELVTDGKDGYVIPICDSDAIVDKLKVLRGDSSLREEMGAAARETAHKYTWERVREMYREEMGL